MAARLFGDDAREAMAILVSYGEGPEHREPDRVRRAILKLSEGDLGRLRHFREQADKDYRDVLWWAEGE